MRTLNLSRAGTAFLAAALTLALAACAPSQAGNTQAAAPPPPEVTVAGVIAKPLRDWQEFTGRLQAVDTVEIRPRVAGFIDSVQFAEGSRVKKGQLLFASIRVRSRPKSIAFRPNCAVRARSRRWPRRIMTAASGSSRST